MSAEAAILLLEVCGLLALLDVAALLILKVWDTGKIGKIFSEANEDYTLIERPSNHFNYLKFGSAYQCAVSMFLFIVDAFSSSLFLFNKIWVIFSPKSPSFIADLEGRMWRAVPCNECECHKRQKECCDSCAYKIRS